MPQREAGEHAGKRKGYREHNPRRRSRLGKPGQVQSRTKKGSKRGPRAEDGSKQTTTPRAEGDLGAKAELTETLRETRWRSAAKGASHWRPALGVAERTSRSFAKRAGNTGTTIDLTEPDCSLSGITGDRPVFNNLGNLSG